MNRRYRILTICSSLTFLIASYLPADALPIGSEAYLHATMPHPHIAVDQAALDAYIKVTAARDIPHGITELYRKRQLFQVDNDVRVRIIASTFTRTQIRFLEGDAQGRSGWVVSEWITISIPETKKAKVPELTSLSQCSNQYPSRLPAGYTKEMKYKYRVIENLDEVFFIYDANKIHLDGGRVVLSPPVFVQEWYNQALFNEKLSRKWQKKISRKTEETNALAPEYVSIIEKEKR